MFGCRTNGALVWDRLREMYELKKDKYGPAEEALKKTPVGQSLVFWQPRDESFPPSGSFRLTRIGTEPGLGKDYAGLIESALASVYHHSRGFTAETDEPLYVTGGATGSEGIMRRVAAIWNRRVIPVEKGGAALGAAVAGVYALYKSEDRELNIEEFSASVLKREKEILPLPEDIAAIHSPGGYLERFITEEGKLLAADF
jgi:xylulokinase